MKKLISTIIAISVVMCSLSTVSAAAKLSNKKNPLHATGSTAHTGALRTHTGTTATGAIAQPKSNTPNSHTTVIVQQKTTAVSPQKSSKTPTKTRSSSTTTTKKVTASQAKSGAKTNIGSDGHTYITGPKWGCYYINDKGNKEYVDHDKCGN